MSGSSSMRLLALAALLSLAAVANAKDKDQQLYPGFLELSDKNADKDGIWWKARYAAQFSRAVCDGKTAGLSVDESKKYEQGGTKLLAATTDRYDLVLSFCSEDGEFAESVSAESKSSKGGMAPVPWLDWLVNGTKYGADVVSSFEGFTSDIKKANEGFNGKGGGMSTKPVNVLCTGAGEAAALVPLCATYAAVTFPQAHILAEGFNGSWAASNGRFNWTHSQIVDTFYYWPADVRDVGDGEVYERGIDGALEKIEDSELLLLSDAGDVAEELFEIIDSAATILIFTPNGTDLTFRVEPTVTGNLSGTYDVVPMQGENYDAKQLKFTIEKFEDVDDCPVVLCKTRFPGFLSGMIYAEYDPKDPEWVGPVPLDNLMKDEEHYERVSGGHDADGAVLYKEETDTLYFIYRGTESNMDWLVDANVLMRDWPVSNGPERIWSDPEVAAGFYQQFTALNSIDAREDEHDFEKIAMKMTKGRVPKLVVCTGQSLGGGLSTLCGGYIPTLWPNATVLTVNEGSPMTGDEEWQKYFDHHVGRVWRLVNEADQVPLLAPLDWYEHVRGGLWIHDGKVLLDQRPPMTLEETNWDDHSYYVYSIVQNTLNKVSAPGWVAEEL